MVYTAPCGIYLRASPLQHPLPPPGLPMKSTFILAAWLWSFLNCWAKPFSEGAHTLKHNRIKSMLKLTMNILMVAHKHRTLKQDMWKSTTWTASKSFETRVSHVWSPTPKPSMRMLHTIIQMIWYHWKRRATALCKHMTTTDQDSVPWSPSGPWSLFRTLDLGHHCPSLSGTL